MIVRFLRKILKTIIKVVATVLHLRKLTAEEEARIDAFLDRLFGAAEPDPQPGPDPDPQPGPDPDPQPGPDPDPQPGPDPDPQPGPDPDPQPGPDPDPQPGPDPDPAPSPGHTLARTQEELDAALRDPDVGHIDLHRRNDPYVIHFWMRGDKHIHGNGAIVSKVHLTHVKNVLIEDVTMVGAGPFKIDHGKSITLHNVTRIGEGMHTSGFGFNGVHHIMVTNYKASEVRDGMGFYNCHHILVRDAELFHISGDGIKHGGTQHARFERVHVSRGTRTDDYHPDGIQVFSANVSPAEYIGHKECTIDAREGSWFQSLFGNNEGMRNDPDNRDLAYKNFVFLDNTIYGCHTHGISYWGAQDVYLSGNELNQIKPQNIPVNRDILDKWDTNPGLVTPSFYFGNGLRINTDGETNVVNKYNGEKKVYKGKSTTRSEVQARYDAIEFPDMLPAPE